MVHPQDSPRHPLGRSVLSLHPANPPSPRHLISVPPILVGGPGLAQRSPPAKLWPSTPPAAGGPAAFLCHPERSGPTFSFAPHFGASGCIVEGPWQQTFLPRDSMEPRNF